MAGPLEGVRVLDLSQIVSGPYAAMILADLGAEVIKVEPIGLGDPLRNSAFERGGQQALYLNNNRGKKAIAVDLHTDAGREIVLELADRADVLLENMRPGSTTERGIDYAAVSARNPRIIYCSVTGFGGSGPWANRPALDPVIQGVTGIVARQQSERLPIPDLVRQVIADKWTAQMAAQSITAALYARERGGEGQRIEVSMLDTALYISWNDLMMDSTLLGDGVVPGLRITDVYQVTDCADGQLIYFMSGLRHRHGLMRALGRSDLIDDPRFVPVHIEPDDNLALGEIVAREFLKLTRDEALARLVTEEVPCAPILEPAEVKDNEQVVHNQALVVWEHPTAGLIRQPRQPAIYSRTPTDFHASCPLPGEHTDEVLRSLGRTPEQIAKLRAEAVVA